MLKAARHFLRRFGALGVMLMVLGAVMPSSEAMACAPGQSGAETSASQTLPVLTTPVEADSCQDCGQACLHGCCHASHVAIPSRDIHSVATTMRFSAPTTWAHVVGEPFGAPAGLERPPRA
jgi:hypothetical protein